MTLLVSILVGVLFTVAVYLMTSRDLKSLWMGVFVLGHAANLAIVSVSGSPAGRTPPVLGSHGAIVGTEVDPLPQALVLTAIVIGFAVQAFALTLLVVTHRKAGSERLKVLESGGDDV